MVAMEKVSENVRRSYRELEERGKCLHCGVIRSTFVVLETYLGLTLLSLPLNNVKSNMGPRGLRHTVKGKQFAPFVFPFPLAVAAIVALSFLSLDNFGFVVIRQRISFPRPHTPPPPTHKMLHGTQRKSKGNKWSPNANILMQTVSR